MRNFIGISVITAAICTTPEVGAAQIEVATPSQEYPDPQCIKPNVKLIKPDYSHAGNIADSGAVGSYNSKVKAYNREAGAYNSCMQSYIGNANGQLKRVQSDAYDKIRRITDSANAQLRHIEGKIANAVKDANEVADEEAVAHK